MSVGYGSVFRTRPLPRGGLQGRFTLMPHVMTDTRRALLAFASAGAADGGHEGICYWAGTEGQGYTRFEKVLVPQARHGPQGVFVSAAAYGAIVRQARQAGLGILAQVHSHPGADTRHSDGDDELIVMPFGGMLSLVAPHYGNGLHSFGDFAVHQYQGSAWVLCDPATVAAQVSGEIVA